MSESQRIRANAGYLPQPTPPPAESNGGFGRRVRNGEGAAANAIATAATAAVGMTGAALPGTSVQGQQMDQMWAMQRESQAFNMEYLALQESIQADNRNFTTLSNLLKARHETAKAAVSNIRA